MIKQILLTLHVDYNESICVFSKTNQNKIQTGGCAPGAPILDPPLTRYLSPVNNPGNRAVLFLNKQNKGSVP